MPGDDGARLGCGQRKRIHRSLGTGSVGFGEAALDRIRGLGDLPGTDGLRRPLQRVGGIHARPGIARGMDGAKVPDALLGEERQELALELPVAGGLAREMVEIDGCLGHRRLGNDVWPRRWRRPGKHPGSAVMVNEALTTFVNLRPNRVSKP
jgi:hypothetical protein